MLEGGADIRFIQQLLGHAKLETTQIYTRVSLEQLKAVHRATHPGARLERRKNDDAPAQEPASGPRILLDEEDEETEPDVQGKSG